ncbi:MAG: hypothetical protein ACKVQQ_05815 [Burkholderiales bacterium]
MTHKRCLAIGVGLALAALAAGCSEDPQKIGQATTYKQGKYQGKPDTRPYEGGPTAYSAAKWQAGDKASWENVIKQRQDAQNEYKRTE